MRFKPGDLIVIGDSPAKWAVMADNGRPEIWVAQPEGGTWMAIDRDKCRRVEKAPKFKVGDIVIATDSNTLYRIISCAGERALCSIESNSSTDTLYDLSTEVLTLANVTDIFPVGALVRSRTTAGLWRVKSSEGTVVLCAPDIGGRWKAFKAENLDLAAPPTHPFKVGDLITTTMPNFSGVWRVVDTIHPGPDVLPADAEAMVSWGTQHMSPQMFEAEVCFKATPAQIQNIRKEAKERRRRTGLHRSLEFALQRQKELAEELDIKFRSPQATALRAEWENVTLKIEQLRDEITGEKKCQN